MAMQRAIRHQMLPAGDGDRYVRRPGRWLCSRPQHMLSKRGGDRLSRPHVAEGCLQSLTCSRHPCSSDIWPAACCTAAAAEEEHACCLQCRSQPFCGLAWHLLQNIQFCVAGGVSCSVVVDRYAVHMWADAYIPPCTDHLTRTKDMHTSHDAPVLGLLTTGHVLLVSGRFCPARASEGVMHCGLLMPGCGSLGLHRTRCLSVPVHRARAGKDH